MALQSDHAGYHLSTIYHRGLVVASYAFPRGAWERENTMDSRVRGRDGVLFNTAKGVDRRSEPARDCFRLIACRQAPTATRSMCERV